MKNNLFIIGDSFCRDTFYVEPRINETKSFWVSDLKKKLGNVDLLCDAEPSRDLQTIIDNWIKVINNVKKNDYLIICVPYFRRTRLPLDEKSYKIIELNETKLINRFVGTHSYNNEKLEFWGDDYDLKFFSENLSVQEIINSSISSQKNFIEIIESLYHLTNGKKYVFSWDEMDVKSNYIENKETIIKNIGVWETHKDVYYETDGEFGSKNDIHWSFRMNDLFADYVFEKLIK